MRRFDCIVVLLASLAFTPACGDDDPAQPAGDSSGAGFQRLTTREAVLNNLEVAWDNRVPSKIDELLDENFTFFLSEGDVNGGGLPAQWPRSAELAITTEWLKSNVVPPVNGPVCRLVRVDLALDEVEWVPAAPPANLGEVLYTTIVYYNFTFEMEPDVTYISSPGARAEFTVREVAVGNGTEWRLFEWRDLGSNSRVVAEQTAVSESTWGGIKALYR